MLGLLGWDTEPLAADGALPADRSPWLPNATAEALWAEPITAPHQCTFDVVASSELTAAQFDARYWGRKPVLIRGWAPPADVSARSARPRLLAEFGERLQVMLALVCLCPCVPCCLCAVPGVRCVPSCVCCCACGCAVCLPVGPPVLCAVLCCLCPVLCLCCLPAVLLCACWYSRWCSRWCYCSCCCCSC